MATKKGERLATDKRIILTLRGDQTDHELLESLAARNNQTNNQFMLSLLHRENARVLVLDLEEINERTNDGGTPSGGTGGTTGGVLDEPGAERKMPAVSCA